MRPCVVFANDDDNGEEEMVETFFRWFVVVRT